MNEDLTKKFPQSDSDKLNSILTSVRSLEVGLDRVEMRVGTLDSRVKQLEQKVDERLYDIRPNWQKVVNDLAQVQETQRRMEDGQELLRGEVREIRTSQRDLFRHQVVVNDAVLRIHGDFHYIDARLHALEVNRKRPNSST
jgi:chromosome segregation ATPase